MLKKFAGKNYGEFKRSLIEVVTNHFADYRKKKKALLAKPATLKTVLNSGSKKAAKIAEKKMKVVKKRVGLTV